MGRTKSLLDSECLRSAVTVANTIILKSFKERVDISYLKLSSLVYLLYKDYLQRTGHSLFNERFEVSLFGPLVPSVEFKFASSDIVSNLGSDAMGNTYAIGSENKDFELSLNSIWVEYGNESGTALAYSIMNSYAFSKSKENGLNFLLDEDIKAEEHTYIKRI